ERGPNLRIGQHVGGTDDAGELGDQVLACCVGVGHQTMFTESVHREVPCPSLNASPSPCQTASPTSASTARTSSTPSTRPCSRPWSRRASGSLATHRSGLSSCRAKGGASALAWIS